MKAHVIINATILNSPRMSGLGVYAYSLLTKLLPILGAERRIDEITLLGDDDRVRELFADFLDLGKLHHRHLPATSPVRRIWQLNRAVREFQVEIDTVFYSPTHHGVVTGGLTQVITIHDLFALLFPKNYRLQYYYFKHYVPRILSKTKRVIVDSDNTATDLHRFYGRVPQSRTVHLAPGERLTNDGSERVKSLREDAFFLFVGASYWYKNCERLIDAFALFRKQSPNFRQQLVFAGGRESYIDRLKTHVADRCPDLADNILFLGYVENSELRWLYEHAEALMITTRYEGFGLPALEAMQFDCPVVASRAGSLPEVCADAAYYVDPENTDEIAAAMLAMVSNPGLRQGLIDAGRQNLGRFSWQKAAEEVFDTIIDALE